VDIISKWVVGSFLPLMQKGLLPFPYGGFAVFQDFVGINFSINHQTNTGAAWGIFPKFHTDFALYSYCNHWGSASVYSVL